MYLPIHLLEDNTDSSLESGRKKKNLLLLLSLLFLPQDKLQGPFSVVAVVCSQSFSLHYQAFWQCEVAISHSNVMWTDS